jgi:hypothetical protein
MAYASACLTLDPAEAAQQFDQICRDRVAREVGSRQARPNPAQLLERIKTS